MSGKPPSGPDCRQMAVRCAARFRPRPSEAPKLRDPAEPPSNGRRHPAGDLDASHGWNDPARLTRGRIEKEPRAMSARRP
ncbi:MAG: hypothetical protein MZV70_56970 [Desulfobacterales bacterium]|nr:hypothetical protein [Desulfobacterales bacterium]